MSVLNLVLLAAMLLLGSLHCTDSYTFPSSSNAVLGSSARGLLGNNAVVGRGAAGFSKRHRIAPFSLSSIPTTEIHRNAAGRSLIRLDASRSPSSGAGGSTKLDVKISTYTFSSHLISLWITRNKLNVDFRIEQKTVTKNVLKEEIDRNYRLVLHDDTVHTIQQVCEIISSVSMTVKWKKNTNKLPNCDLHDLKDMPTLYRSSCIRSDFGSSYDGSWNRVRR